MGAGTVEKAKTGKESLDAKVAERKSAAELREAKAAREKREAEDAAKVAKQSTPPANGRAGIDAAHKALGTAPGVVPGHEGSDIHAGDEDDDLPRSASGAPVQLGFTVGGKKPTGSQVRIVGGKVEVPGDYRKGQVVAFRVTVKFGEISFVDLEDKETGQVVGCDRRQKGRIVAIAEES